MRKQDKNNILIFVFYSSKDAYLYYHMMRMAHRNPGNWHGRGKSQAHIPHRLFGCFDCMALVHKNLTETQVNLISGVSQPCSITIVLKMWWYLSTNPQSTHQMDRETTSDAIGIQLAHAKSQLTLQYLHLSPHGQRILCVLL